MIKRPIHTAPFLFLDRLCVFLLESVFSTVISSADCCWRYLEREDHEWNLFAFCWLRVCASKYMWEVRGEFICALKAAVDATKRPIHLSQLGSPSTTRQLGLIRKISACCQHTCNLPITCRIHPDCLETGWSILVSFDVTTSLVSVRLGVWTEKSDVTA